MEASTHLPLAGHGMQVAGSSREVARKLGAGLGLCAALTAGCGGRGEQRSGAVPPPSGGTTGCESACTAGGPAANAGGGAGESGTASHGGSSGAPLGGSAGASLGGEAAGGVASVEPPPRRPIRTLQLATGRDHGCALLENHQLKCWGENSYGQLGLGDQTNRGLDPSLMGDELPFVDLGSGRSAKAIAAGRYSSCALLDDDHVKCWGLENLTPDFTTHGLVGAAPGEMGDALRPIELGPGHTARGVAIGHYEACVVRDDDSFWCGATGAPAISIPATSGARSTLWTGASGVLSLYDDGSARTAASATPPMVLVPGGAVAVAGSMQLSCALLMDGSLQCFGVGKELLPSELPPIRGMAISERGILCGVLADGSVRCWGRIGGPLGWGTATSAGELSETVAVPLTGPALQISSSARDHHCALLVDGAVECWSWIEAAVAGVGWHDVASAELRPVDLGTWPE